MKIGFVIDKPQTFQIIAKLLKSALERGHECTLYSCSTYSQKDIASLDLKTGFLWIFDQNKNRLINSVIKDRSNFDVIYGINFFHRGWEDLYEVKKSQSYGLEYCWNEIYHTSKDLAPGRPSTTVREKDSKISGLLLCNTEKSKQIIENNLGKKDKTLFLGSPWFELINLFKKEKRKDTITFMTPHTSMYPRVPNLRKKTETIIHHLSDYAKLKEFKLILKDRQKYKVRYSSTISWDQIISDDKPFSHLETYSSSNLVINFCSSAINELCFLNTPILCIGPEIQKSLNKTLNDVYYSEPFFDNIHAAGVEFDQALDKKILYKKLDSILNSKKQWDDFNKIHFPGEHIDASVRIIKYAENIYEKNTTNTAIV